MIENDENAVPGATDGVDAPDPSEVGAAGNDRSTFPDQPVPGDAPAGDEAPADAPAEAPAADADTTVPPPGDSAPAGDAA